MKAVILVYKTKKGFRRLRFEYHTDVERQRIICGAEGIFGKPSSVLILGEETSDQEGDEESPEN